MGIVTANNNNHDYEVKLHTYIYLGNI